ncbi:skin secretory protein xP2-like [Sylvia atricapilla]|uniref:skin secretory protein xP2-like n=1 Tax=Sylvia atricapilla TaxID=48155 RepID=UPI00339244CD
MGPAGGAPAAASGPCAPARRSAPATGTARPQAPAPPPPHGRAPAGAGPARAGRRREAGTAEGMAEGTAEGGLGAASAAEGRSQEAAPPPRGSAAPRQRPAPSPARAFPCRLLRNDAVLTPVFHTVFPHNIPRYLTAFSSCLLALGAAVCVLPYHRTCAAAS